MKAPALLGLALIVVGILLIAGDALRSPGSSEPNAAATPAPHLTAARSTSASPVALGVLSLAAGVGVLALAYRR